jgi:hypothetical protein
MSVQVFTFNKSGIVGDVCTRLLCSAKVKLFGEICTKHFCSAKVELIMLCLRSKAAFVITCVHNLMEVKVLYIQRGLLHELFSYWCFNV